MRRRKEIRRTGTFVATNGRGRKHVIHKLTEYELIETFAGSEWAEGLQHLMTSDGNHVNRKDKGAYEILAGGGEISVTSDDPEAP